MNKKGGKRMFFWQKQIFLIQINSFKASLQSCHMKNNPNKSDIRNNPKRIKMKTVKRTFSFAPSYYQASMCLEASLSLSFFLLFMVNIFSIISLFMTYTQNLVTLQQQGKKIAAYSYLAKGVMEEEEDIIRLQNTALVKAPFSFFAMPTCKIDTRCVVKSWTGYDVTGLGEWKQEENMVYITEYGEVYHKNRECSYLCLSIQATDAGSVNDKRNEAGERYLPCEYCKSDSMITVVYVTAYGNRYHITTGCRGIKRTVNRVPISRIKEETPCKKCG